MAVLLGTLIIYHLLFATFFSFSTVVTIFGLGLTQIQIRVPILCQSTTKLPSKDLKPKRDNL
jgi:hypothetical protein